MSTQKKVRKTLSRLRRTVDKTPNDFDKIEGIMADLADLADEDWDAYTQVMKEEGVEIFLEDVNAKRLDKRQVNRLARELGIKDISPTEDNIAGVFHAYRLRQRAFLNALKPKRPKPTGDPLKDDAVWFPSDERELAAMLEEANREGRRVSVVGSFRSESGAPDVRPLDKDVPGATIVITSFLNRKLKVDVKAQTYTCGPGRAIWQINADLEEAGLAMINLGGGDFQTLAGALGTATHGSGMDFPDFSQLVTECEFMYVDGSGKAVSKTLKRGEDDDINAVIVSMGSMGVITSLTIQVVDKFWLRESRVLMPWTDCKQVIDRYLDGSMSARHFEILVNPYPSKMNIKGIVDADFAGFPKKRRKEEDHLCIVTRRWEVPESKVSKSTGRPKVMDIAQRGLGRYLAKVGLGMMLNAPKSCPTRIEGALKSNQVDNNIGLSWHVLKLGLYVEATAAEYGLPAHRGADAADEILRLAQKRMNEGAVSFTAGPKKRREFWTERPAHTSPISLRYVKAGDSYLAMNHKRDSCMIEVPMLKNMMAEDLDSDSKREKLFDAYTEGRAVMYRQIYRVLDKRIRGPGDAPIVRPHWGLEDPAPAGDGWVKERYPEYKAWLDAYRRYNPHGLFNGAWTDRMGISTGGR